MNQQITCSSSIVNYLYENISYFNSNDALKCYEFLDQNYFVLDSNQRHSSKILDLIDQLPDSDKTHLLRKVILKWLLDKRLEVNLETSDLEYELELAKNTDDKIYFDPSMTEKHMSRLAKKQNEVEVYSVKTFIEPEHYHKLKHLPSTISLDKDSFYDLNKILLPFLKNEESLEIIDPFLFNPHARFNFFNLIKNIKATKITLYVLTSKKIDKKNDYNIFIDERNKIKNNKPIIKDIESKKHLERYILTENYQIYLPGGFDSIKDDGKPNLDEDWEIAEIRIEKRNR